MCATPIVNAAGSSQLNRAYAELGEHYRVLLDDPCRRDGCEEDEAERRLIRRSGLEGALARPMWHEHFGDPDIAYLAAVLAHGLAEGQLFIDGNERTAFLARAVFLDRIGCELNASGDEMADWIIELSAGGTVEQLADRVRAALGS